MATTQKIFYHSSSDMKEIADESIALVVTSPPYPMIEMWDEIFFRQDEKIAEAFQSKNYNTVFNLIHDLLRHVWKEIYRVMIPGGIVCINIGDATRTLDGMFRLFSNHSRIIRDFEDLGFISLPDIIWRKPTNAPNKFMGSGMYPPGAYVTFEHEYILIFRKGDKRQFKQKDEIQRRHESSYFWEERNIWFSDTWDLKGTGQNISGLTSRERSAAYPFELSYRLINMFSIKGDTVLDPFLGTGTTLLSAMASERNGIGYEIDGTFAGLISKSICGSKKALNEYIRDRLARHIAYMKTKEEKAEKKLYKCEHHGFSVKTKQETEIQINCVDVIKQVNDGLFEAEYMPATYADVTEQTVLF